MTDKSVHLIVWSRDTTACGVRYIHPRGTRSVTGDSREVSCGNCKRTRVFAVAAKWRKVFDSFRKA